MAKSMNVKAVASNLKVGEKPFYRLIIDGAEIVKSEDFLRRYAAATRLPTSEAQFNLDTFAQVLSEFLLEAKTVSLPYLLAKLSIGGSVKSMTDQPTKEANPVYANISVKGQIADALSGIVLKNVTVSVDAALHEVMQNGASGVARIENSGDIVITGKGLMIDAGAEDEGVWLEKSGTVVKMAELKGADHNEARANFGSLDGIENGVYDLCVATRDGKSASECPARILRRKVTVAK